MRFCSSDLAAAAALDAFGGFIVERRGVDARSSRRMALSTVRARSITSAGGCIRCRRQQQIERRAGGGWR